MPHSRKTITETENAFIINGIEIPKMKATRLNIYNSTQIKAVGIEAFLDLVSEKEPILPPDLGFTEEEWDEMEKLLKEDWIGYSTQILLSITSEVKGYSTPDRSFQ